MAIFICLVFERIFKSDWHRVVNSWMFDFFFFNLLSQMNFSADIMNQTKESPPVVSSLNTDSGVAVRSTFLTIPISQSPISLDRLQLKKMCSQSEIVSSEQLCLQVGEAFLRMADSLDSVGSKL